MSSFDEITFSEVDAPRLGDIVPIVVGDVLTRGTCYAKVERRKNEIACRIANLIRSFDSRKDENSQI